MVITESKLESRWDDNLEYIFFTQDFGDKFLNINDDENAISQIIKSISVLLELNWYGQGKTYFNFSLGGSSSAIKTMRKYCKK